MNATAPPIALPGPSRRRLLWLRLPLVVVVAALAACGGGETAGGTDQASARKTAASESGGSTGTSWPSLSSVFDDEPVPEAGEGGAPKALVMTQADAVRLANQATFGPTESLVTQIREWGASRWVADQMSLQRQAFKPSPNGPRVPVIVPLPRSRYTSGGTNAVHKHTSQGADFCDNRGDQCWRDW